MKKYISEQIISLFSSIYILHSLKTPHVFNKIGSELFIDLHMCVLPCAKVWGVSPWWSHICTAHSSVYQSSWSTGADRPGAQNANFLYSGRGWWVDTLHHLHSDRSCTSKNRSTSRSFNLSFTSISISFRSFNLEILDWHDCVYILPKHYTQNK